MNVTTAFSCIQSGSSPNNFSTKGKMDKSFYPNNLGGGIQLGFEMHRHSEAIRAEISGQRPRAVNGLFGTGSKGQRNPSPSSRGLRESYKLPWSPNRKCILDALRARKTRLLDTKYSLVHFPFHDSIWFLVFCQSWILGPPVQCPVPTPWKGPGYAYVDTLSNSSDCFKPDLDSLLPV